MPFLVKRSFFLKLPRLSDANSRAVHMLWPESLLQRWTGIPEGGPVPVQSSAHPSGTGPGYRGSPQMHKSNVLSAKNRHSLCNRWKFFDLQTPWDMIIMCNYWE